MKVLQQIARIVLPLTIGTYLLWYFFDSMSDLAWTQFKQAFRNANYGWIALSLFLSYLTLVVRAFRWKYTLEPLNAPSSFWNRYHALLIGYIANLTIPRAGEATRSAMLYRSEAVPFALSFGTIIAERAVDVFMLGLVVLVCIWVARNDFWEIKNLIFNALESEGQSSNENSIVIYSVLIFCVLLIVFLLWKKPEFIKKVLGFVTSLVKGVFSIFKLKNPFAYIWQTFAIWFLYILYFIVAFNALPETANLPIEAKLLAFLAGSLGITFTNGGIGAFPLMVGFVVDFYLPGEKFEGLGGAIGMLIWSSQTLMMIVLGLISLWILPKKYIDEQPQ